MYKATHTQFLTGILTKTKQHDHCTASPPSSASSPPRSSHHEVSPCSSHTQQLSRASQSELTEEISTHQKHRSFNLSFYESASMSLGLKEPPSCRVCVEVKHWLKRFQLYLTEYYALSSKTHRENVDKYELAALLLLLQLRLLFTLLCS